MLTTVKGTYRNGQIELQEPPVDVLDETPVIVIFLNSTDVDLRALGISEGEAAELRAALTPFEDWDAPEMDIYNDYDAAKANSETR
jgi:hypothetical protein